MVNKLWYIYIIEYYSGMKRSYWYTQQLGWTSKVLCLEEKESHTLWLHYVNSQNDKIIVMENRLVVSKGCEVSRVQLFATPWTVAYQAPLSMEFSRQEYWSGVPFPLGKRVRSYLRSNGREFLCSDWTVVYPECSDVNLNLHVVKFYRTAHRYAYNCIKNWWILNNICTWVNSVVSMWISWFWQQTMVI